MTQTTGLVLQIIRTEASNRFLPTPRRKRNYIQCILTPFLPPWKAARSLVKYHFPLHGSPLFLGMSTLQSKVWPQLGYVYPRDCMARNSSVDGVKGASTRASNASKYRGPQVSLYSSHWRPHDRIYTATFSPARAGKTSADMPTHAASTPRIATNSSRNWSPWSKLSSNFPYYH